VTRFGRDELEMWMVMVKEVARIGIEWAERIVVD